MALDYTKLSEQELQAIANNDYSQLSESTLSAIASEPEEKKQATVADLAQTTAQAFAPAGMYGPTGLPQLGRDLYQAAQPMVDVGRSVVQGYKSNPLGGLTDAVLLHGGLPPVFGGAKSAEAMYNMYKGVQQTAGNISEMLSKLPPGTDRAAAPFVNALNPADQARFFQLAKTQGIEQAFKTYQAPGYLGAEAVQSLNAVKGAFPTTLQKIGQVAAPIARGIGKIAGPAGMALNMYDAGQMARETELGPRLAQGQGGRAEQAFRAGPVATYQGPQIGVQQAQNVLQSGSPRDIKYFSGQDSLREEMRRKAAARVAGPIAPGQI